jgi:hypothetical protein
MGLKSSDVRTPVLQHKQVAGKPADQQFMSYWLTLLVFSIYSVFTFYKTGRKNKEKLWHTQLIYTYIHTHIHTYIHIYNTSKSRLNFYLQRETQLKWRCRKQNWSYQQTWNPNGAHLANTASTAPNTFLGIQCFGFKVAKSVDCTILARFSYHACSLRNTKSN